MLKKHFACCEKCLDVLRIMWCCRDTVLWTLHRDKRPTVMFDHRSIVMIDHRPTVMFWPTFQRYDFRNVQRFNPCVATNFLTLCFDQRSNVMFENQIVFFWTLLIVNWHSERHLYVTIEKHVILFWIEMIHDVFLNVGVLKSTQMSVVISQYFRNFEENTLTYYY